MITMNTAASTAVKRTLLSHRLPVTAIASRFMSEAPAKRQSKVGKKKKKGKSEEGGRDKVLDLVLRALDSKKKQPPKPDEEEAARRYQIGRNYVIGRFEQHNTLENDLSCKLAMKHHAIKLLPRNSYIREAALTVDDTIPPYDRHIPRWYPPI